ncbi:alpha/beta hydrolase [Ornithinibacillus halotolerans]|uniref:Esterase family protein n=1 Tax=Ornithinibacillus halotolerans TaxID=1274357 RepID=A0A916S1V6_9BACI|nr:alpha/beta hydrolase-fold protein [Ornithinibacillus halotolerans]GGA79525.1 hypothetical protein GCM10008025_23660 [Ornithinibacillus halotolerans]
MKQEVIASKYLNREIAYRIIPPASNRKSVNMLYVQDGNDYLELGAFQETFETLVNQHSSLDNWMVVLIHPGTSEERWHSYHHRGDSFHHYISFMYEELIPKVEKNLIVMKRAALGDSLAANISVNIASKKPAMWNHLLLQSAAISEEDITAVAAMEGPVNWHVHQTVGMYEDEFISPITKEQLFIYTRNIQLQQVLQEKGVHLRFDEEEESHLWVYWKRILPNALKTLID